MAPDERRVANALWISDAGVKARVFLVTQDYGNGLCFLDDTMTAMTRHSSSFLS